MCNNSDHPLRGKTLKSNVYARLRYVDYDRASRIIRGGIIVNVVDAIAKKLGFQVSLVLTPDWTAFLPNGTVKGSIGDVRKWLQIGDHHPPHSHIPHTHTYLWVES